MSSTQSRRGTGDVRAAAAELLAIREHLSRIARGIGHDDLAAILDGLQWEVTPGPARVVIAGETNRGKSRLVNALVGRPLLSPVGVDVTTACWVHLSYGESDRATVLLADASGPRRLEISLQEVEQYASLREVAAPVIGVEIQVAAPLLMNISLIDTPGVGGLVAGHAETTLTALNTADALVFVCDSTQPILAPEVEFLVRAAARVPTIAIAVTKCDNPGADVVVRETRARLSGEPALATLPIFSVSARLAERAAEEPDPVRATRLADLAGMGSLVRLLTRDVSQATSRQRVTLAADLTLGVARELADAAAAAAADIADSRARGEALRAEVQRLSRTLDDQPRLTLMIQHRLAGLQSRPRDQFDAAVNDIRTRYTAEAERAPAAQLKTLALRLAEEITAAAVAALEEAVQQAVQLVRDILTELDSVGSVADLPLRDPRYLDLRLGPDLGGRRTTDISGAGQVLQGVAQLMTASAGASVITGIGLVAAGIALVACTGWWLIRAVGEQRSRSRLREWVEGAAIQAGPAFAAELHERVTTVRQYVSETVPELIALRRRQLDRAESALAAVSGANTEGQRAATARLAATRTHLDELAGRTDRLVTLLRTDGASG